MLDEASTAPPLEKRSRLFIRHQRMLRAYIRSLVDDPHDSEDLLQEVGVLILGLKDEEVNGEEFPAWCRAVAYNVVRHYWRSRTRARERPSDRYAQLVETAYAEVNDLGAEDGPWTERRRALVDCLSHLAPGDRRMLDFRYVDGLNSEAIADKTRRSPGAVRMMLLRIRERLLRCIERRSLKPAAGGRA